MNLLFITCDQWRAECLSVLGHPVVRTPHIDALAHHGVLFTRHYAQAAPCSPSRTSMHTGAYMHNNRVCVNGIPYDGRYSNWARELRNHGHDPYLIGYTDTPANPLTLHPGDPRLTHYSEPLPGLRTDTFYRHDTPADWVAHLVKKGYAIPDYWWDLYWQETPGRQWEDGGDAPLPLAIAAEDHETRFNVDRGIQWIEQQHGAWVLHLSLLRPHPPFIAPEPYNRAFDPGGVDACRRLDTPGEEGRQHPWLAYQLSRDSYRAPKNPDTLARLKAVYYGLMKEVDDNLGRLFTRLRELGQWDDTFIIFTSDHGEQMGDHWLMRKSGYFDASYHIPLIIRDPGKEARAQHGTRVTRFTENVDIMPTILARFGLDIPGQCDGRSLTPFLEQGRAPRNWREEAHWEYDFRDPEDRGAETALGLSPHQCAINVIRGERYKYVHFTALPPLFFDLDEDPHEFHDRAGDPGYRERMLEYARKLISWRMNHDDRGLTETFLRAGGPVTRRAPLYPGAGGIMKLNFPGESALVAGAGGGMGLEIAARLIRAGVNVCMADVKPRPADIPHGPGRCLYRQTDLGDEAAVNELVDAAQGEFGGIHYLVNTVGVLWFEKDRSAVEMDMQVWDQVMAINLRAAVLLARRVIPLMQKGGGGAMVHFSSIDALSGDPAPQDAYGASKAALIRLSRSLAVQFAGDAIRANVILPGPALTPMQARWRDQPEAQARVSAGIPLGRLGTPADMAGACLFLLSDEASWITGTELVVDGGVTALP